MSIYRVSGVVAGDSVDCVTEADHGADAILVVARSLRPVISRDEQQQKGSTLRRLEREWIAKNVRLSAKQIS